ncbi:MAG: N-acetylglucosamine-6-phosphate deacetylase, partial [Caulobacteraceae bacterium]
AGVVVSAGHSDASYQVTRAALDHGLSGFTHLFNAMSPLTNREPGMVGAALEDQRSWCSLIVDGVHVDPVVLKLALRLKPADRFILVTDSMPAVGAEETSFMLQGRRISVRDGACYDEAGTLAGSLLTMAAAVRNAVSMLGLDVCQAARMASRNPAEFLGLDHARGRIALGAIADLVLINEDFEVEETWISGRASGEAHA